MKEIQAHLEDMEGLIPDCHNKANITIKWVTQVFWFSHVYKSYVYTILLFIKCATLFLKKKNNIHTLI